MTKHIEYEEAVEFLGESKMSKAKSGRIVRHLMECESCHNKVEKLKQRLEAVKASAKALADGAPKEFQEFIGMLLAKGIIPMSAKVIAIPLKEANAEAKDYVMELASRALELSKKAVRLDADGETLTLENLELATSPDWVDWFEHLSECPRCSERLLLLTKSMTKRIEILEHAHRGAVIKLITFLESHAKAVNAAEPNPQTTSAQPETVAEDSVKSFSA